MKLRNWLFWPWWVRRRSSAPGRVSVQHRRPRSARPPPHTPQRRHRSPSGARRPVRDRAGRPGRVFGSENFGNKFPGEAAVYMGIVHVAIYDAAVAIEGGYRPYAPTPAAPRRDTSAGGRDRHRSLRHAHRACSPQLGAEPDDPRRRPRRLHGRHPRRCRRRRMGSRSASRSHRPCSPCARTTAAAAPTTLTDLGPPPPGPGVWQPPRRHGARPLPPGDAAARAHQRLAVPARRPERPRPSQEYADDLNQVQQLGPLRQHDQDAGADERGALLDRPRHPAVERRPAPPCCRPRARPRADGPDAGDGARRGRRRDDRLLRREVPLLVLAPVPSDPARGHRRQPGTVADPTWLPLRTTPNFPEYPSAHACHSTGVVEALGRVLRHRQGRVLARQPRHRHDATSTTASTTSSRTSTGPASLSASTSATPTCRARARAEGRPLRRRPLFQPPG